MEIDLDIIRVTDSDARVCLHVRNYTSSFNCFHYMSLDDIEELAYKLSSLALKLCNYRKEQEQEQ